MTGNYMVEAVRDLEAMNRKESPVMEGELLTLILDNGKLCLVHRKDDLPFVVPKPYIVHKEQHGGRRTGSFSTFLQGRKCSKRKTVKYPMSSYNLESVCPQFASVDCSSSATSVDEVSLEQDTAVLILNADPQSLMWYGVTQCGKYGMLSSRHVSIITPPGMPSLQKGCRLTTHARHAYHAQDPRELTVEKGSYLEVIGMPELWRWQVRLSSGDKRIGLLPTYVLNEVSVISCPEESAESPKAASKLNRQVPRSPSLFTADIDENWPLMEAAAGHATMRRHRDPLPAVPVVGSLNDLNRPSAQIPRYINQHNSFSEDPYSAAQPLESDEGRRPQRLEGVSTFYDVCKDYRAPVPRADHAFDELAHWMEVIRQDRETLKRSNQKLAADRAQQVKHWKQTTSQVVQIVNSARIASEGLNGSDEEPVRRPNHYFNEPTLTARQRGDSHTLPRPKPIPMARKRSLASYQSPQRQDHQMDHLGAFSETNILPRSESQPALDMHRGELPYVRQNDVTTGTGYSYDMLNQRDIDAIVDCVCPIGEKRPLLHWKPVLVKLGLDLETAIDITKINVNTQDEWRLALQAWLDKMGQNATMSTFLEELQKSGRESLSNQIIWRGRSMIRQRLYCSMASLV